MLNFYSFFSKFRNFCQNLAEFSPNLTKMFRDFSKMQQGRDHVRDVLKGRRLPRGFPDVLQFGGQPTQPTVRPFSARSSASRPAASAGRASRSAPLSRPWHWLLVKIKASPLGQVSNAWIGTPTRAPPPSTVTCVYSNFFRIVNY